MNKCNLALTPLVTHENCEDQILELSHPKSGKLRYILERICPPHQRCPCPNPQICDYFMLHAKEKLTLPMELNL